MKRRSFVPYLIALALALPSCSEPSMSSGARCGDGRVDLPEDCDDGNALAGDGCSAACAKEVGFVCSGEAPSTCVVFGCGDGLVTEGEACDDGNRGGGDGCTEACDVARGFTCAGAPSRCEPTCGDAQRVGEEACDDGNARDGDGCSVTCAIERGFDCPDLGQACLEICGDGLQVGREDCDDGNLLPLDGCSPFCAVSSGWRALAAPSAPPSPRYEHTSVWTGQALLVWGGFSPGTQGDGASYDPVNDLWKRMPPAPLNPRAQHTAVWTGSEMIIFGGAHRLSPVEQSEGGAAYDPVRGTWRPLSTRDMPSTRQYHTAVWTGSEMIVFGGLDARGAPLSDGGAYDPVADTWRPINASVTRAGHSAVWTGRAMIVFGGANGRVLGDGAAYDPVADTWTALPTANGPGPRLLPAAVWTGSAMLVFGGQTSGDAYSNVLSAYDPERGVWSRRATPPLAARRNAEIVWTGSEAVVFGGDAPTAVAGAARYAPALDAWQPLPELGAPSARTYHTVTWTGSEVIVWGGADGRTRVDGDGARFDPTGDAWRPVFRLGGAPSPRLFPSAVWTGSEVLFFGGVDHTGPVADHAGYSTARADWSAIAAVGAPAPRALHTAVWTGARALIFGGQDFETWFGDGAAYDPVLDAWASLPVENAPSARASHTAVWTGAEMIVWGGVEAGVPFSDGATFDPSLDRWLPLPTEGAPTARWRHTAVWTGTEMIVFGGGGSAGSPGGRYDVGSRTWAPLADNGAPARRRLHTAVWTGTEMIVFGGFAVGAEGELLPDPLGDGGRFDPATGVWSALPTEDAPSPRGYHSAVWTGRELIIWGGTPRADDNGGALSDGARYLPALDRWIKLEMDSAPAPRFGHGAAWTDTGMVVFGGVGDGTHGNGGIYGL